MKPRKLITKKQSAERLGVAISTIGSWLKKGKLTRYKVSRLTRVDADEVEALIIPDQKDSAA